MINFLIFFILIASFFLIDFDVYRMLLGRYKLRSLEKYIVLNYKTKKYPPPKSERVFLIVLTS